MSCSLTMSMKTSTIDNNVVRNYRTLATRLFSQYTNDYFSIVKNLDGTAGAILRPYFNQSIVALPVTENDLWLDARLSTFLWAASTKKCTAENGRDPVKRGEKERQPISMTNDWFQRYRRIITLSSLTIPTRPRRGFCRKGFVNDL